MIPETEQLYSQKLSEIPQNFEESKPVDDIFSLNNAWLLYRKEIIKNYPQLANEYKRNRINKKQYLNKYELIQNTKKFANLMMFQGLQKYLQGLNDKSFKFKFLQSCSKIFSKPFLKEIITLILYWYYKYEKDKQILNQALFLKLIDEGTEEMAWIINNLYSEWFLKLQLKSRYYPKTIWTQKIAQKYEYFLKKLVKMTLMMVKLDRLCRSL